MRGVELCILAASAAMSSADDAVLCALRESATELKHACDAAKGEALSLNMCIDRATARAVHYPEPRAAVG